MVFIVFRPFQCTTQSRVLTTMKKRAFENLVGKGENAGYQHFLLFSQGFLHCQTITTVNLSSANGFNLDKSTILSFCKRSTYEGKELVDIVLTFINIVHRIG